MSGSQQVTLIVDVDDSSATFQDWGYWQYIEDPVWYGEKVAFMSGPMSNLGSLSGTLQPVTYFNMSFHGTSITFSGFVADSRVELDDIPTTEIAFRANPLKVTVSYWYQSPPLLDQEHKVQAKFNTFNYVDYALINAGSTTDLATKTIFVDDANEEMWYTGQWKVEANATYLCNTSNPIPALPYYFYAANRTVHSSNTSGDSFEFRFSGTSISVYGLHAPSGDYAVDFIVDGSIRRANYPHDHDPQDGWMTNYKFYENTTLSPGNHTLVVNVTDVRNSSFLLDYITYTPSFSFIQEKPIFIRGSADSQASQTRSLGLHIGAIVGIVIGSVFIIITIGLFYLSRRKRSTSRKAANVSWPVEPFTTRFAGGTKPKPAKWREMFGDTYNLMDPTGETSHLEPIGLPQNTAEIQQRNAEIASLTTEMENSDNPTRGELFARINMLTMEVERLMRENAPPEYGRNDFGQRPGSLGTLPSYDHREGTQSAQEI
ncbi:hypothetical protein VNI00_014765 [Paramarasmius palmivorus]|uniref:Uncharacterized protein n=1 Tax=Paramarasmius palmivorus TaxID=297713 RepID=A0AAW0BQN0_9AGAR